MAKEPINTIDRLGKELMELFNTQLNGYVLQKEKKRFSLFKTASTNTVATHNEPEVQHNVSVEPKNTK